MVSTGQISAEFAADYLAARERTLRRRVTIYCLVIAALFALSCETGAEDVMEYGLGTALGDLSLFSSSLDFAVVLMHLVAAIVVWWVRPERERLVRLFCWLVFLLGGLFALLNPIAEPNGPFPSPDVVGVDRIAMTAGLYLLLQLFMLHAVASMLVALSPQEGLRPTLGLVVVFIISVLLHGRGSTRVQVTLIALAPLIGLPGFLYSWWRHRSFTEHFHAQAVMARYPHVKGELGQISRELEEARRLHEALLPEPMTDGPVRLNYHYSPMRALGGDFLFARRLPDSDGAHRLMLVVFDVTGHGVAAAMTAARLNDTILRLAEDAGSGAVRPADIIAGMNDFVVSSLADQSMYATAVCVIVTVTPAAGVHPARGTVQWANAGHPPMLLQHAAGDVRRLDSTAPMLGVIAADAFRREDLHHPIRPGDRLVIYTDGAMEVRDARGVGLGVEGLEAVLTRRRHGELSAAIAAEVNRHRVGPVADDVLIAEVTLAP